MDRQDETLLILDRDARCEIYIPNPAGMQSSNTVVSKEASHRIPVHLLRTSTDMTTANDISERSCCEL